MKVLVTRPAVDAAGFSSLLEAAGYEPVLSPLMTIDFGKAGPLEIEGITHLAFTSANGVRAFCEATDRQDIPAFVIGPATARQAGQAGYRVTGQADSNVESMAALIAARVPEQSSVLHVTGRHQAGNLVALLKEQGITARKTILYEAREISHLDAAVVASLKAGEIEAVTFFSPRTARLFCDRARKAGIGPESGNDLGEVVAVCLSAAVAREITPGLLQEIHVAKSPNPAAMIDILKSRRT